MTLENIFSEGGQNLQCDNNFRFLKYPTEDRKENIALKYTNLALFRIYS